jgi:putative FmdB family regulatory protein
MPLYDFHCNDCGKDFELPLSVKDYERKDFACPGCRSKNLERMVAGVGVITAKKS